jgi:hypothetical protein
MAAKILIERRYGNGWEQQTLAKKILEELVTGGRLVIWGESAVPFFLTGMWALDKLRGDQFSDKFLLLPLLAAIAHLNSSPLSLKLGNPYQSADEANAKAFRSLFEQDKATEVLASASYSLHSLVTIAARRLWRNHLAAMWTFITRIDSIELVPDKPRDLLLWNWEHKRGRNQARRFGVPQSWRELLVESRRNEDDSLPGGIKDHLDFALLFVLCYPHRLTPALVKHLEEAMRY